MELALVATSKGGIDVEGDEATCVLELHFHRAEAAFSICEPALASAERTRLQVGPAYRSCLLSIRDGRHRLPLHQLFIQLQVPLRHLARINRRLRWFVDIDCFLCLSLSFFMLSFLLAFIRAALD